jgi:hypothetical protein
MLSRLWEFSMKVTQWAVGLSLAAATLGSVAHAETGFYATASMAQSTCGADPVVWIDLDRGRYYQVGTVDYGKSSNGVYACEKVAHAKYREGHSEPTAVAKQ